MDTSRCVWCEHNLDTLRRLAKYEDSGLTPNRVAELLKKLTEAISGQLDSDTILGDVYGFVVGGELLSALDKLAEYESTGLSPKEINSLNDFEHSQRAISPVGSDITWRRLWRWGNEKKHK